jgi:hypothetical protein
MPVSLSVIIPLGPGDDAWRELMPDLDVLEDRAEILLVATADDALRMAGELPEGSASSRMHLIVSPAGRAAQLNAGAAQANGEYLLFLHADSRVAVSAWEALFASLERFPERLHYFNLRFRSDGPRRMRLNEWGVWLRSHWLGIPFGDQGLCLRTVHFRGVGPYDESIPYGEDHVFVWAARLHGLRLQCTGSAIETSARKYRDEGWFRTTLRHLVLTIKQAAPYFRQLVCRRWCPWSSRRGRSD